MNARQVNQASPARLSVVAWPDPAVEGAGHRPGSAYVEAVWLGVLGPSATFAWCRLARLAAARPGTSVDTVDLAVSLGLGEGLGPNATISRTLGRLVAFGIAQRSGEIVAVRTALPDVSARQACRLSASARLAHERLGHGRPGLDGPAHRASVARGPAPASTTNGMETAVRAEGVSL